MLFLPFYAFDATPNLQIRPTFRVVPYKAMAGWSCKASVGVERRRERPPDAVISRDPGRGERRVSSALASLWRRVPGRRRRRRAFGGARRAVVRDAAAARRGRRTMRARVAGAGAGVVAQQRRRVHPRRGTKIVSGAFYYHTGPHTTASAW